MKDWKAVAVLGRMLAERQPPKGSRRRSVTVTDYEYNYIQNWLKTHRESQDE